MTLLMLMTIALSGWGFYVLRSADRELDLAELLLVVTPPVVSAVDARDPGAADTGARAVSPPSGAGPTTVSRRPHLQPAQRAPGDPTHRKGEML
jgi:hypothetical protein